MTLSVPRTCTPRMCEEARRHRRHSARARRRSTGRTRAAPSPSTCRGGAEGATRVRRGCVEGAEGRCGRAVQAGGAGGWCGELGGGAVRRGHRVRGGAEAAAERLVVVVVGVVHRVGLREVDGARAGGVQQLGGHHLHGQRASTVHAVHRVHGIWYTVYSKLGRHRACTELTTVPLPPPPPVPPPPPRALLPPRSASCSPRAPGCSKKYSQSLSPWLVVGLRLCLGPGLGLVRPQVSHCGASP